MAGRSTSKLNWFWGGAGAGFGAAFGAAFGPAFAAGRLTAAGKPTSPASAGRSRSSRPGNGGGTAAIAGAVGFIAKPGVGGEAAGFMAGRAASKSSAGIGGAGAGGAAFALALVGGFGARPTIVAFFGGGFGAAPPSAAGTAPFDGSVTRNVCPHLGQRIFSPVGGTRRSSTW